MNTELEKWIEESDENRRNFSQEGLILSVTEEIWDAMGRRKVNKLALAELLHTGKSHVTQLLSGARNMTLRTLSDVADALHQRVEIHLVDKERGAWTDYTRGVMTHSMAVAPFRVEAANDQYGQRVKVERQA